MKNHSHDCYEISGEFKDGNIWNGDELTTMKNGEIVLFVWEEGIKVTKITANDANPDIEQVTDLRK